jgi:D-sedoheptulose 7-phosphate isomerase
LSNHQAAVVTSDQKRHGLESYGALLAEALASVTVTCNGQAIDAETAVERVVAQLLDGNRHEGRVFFVGNGGSAAIASHCAADYMKNGRLRALSLHDPAVLTCIANDLGYERVFADQLLRHAKRSDLLFIISSSGESPNILQAARAAREMSMIVITLSGFAADNSLRTFGDIDFHVPRTSYGIVEVAHLAICHAVLDRAMGIW